MREKLTQILSSNYLRSTAMTPWSFIVKHKDGTDETLAVKVLGSAKPQSRFFHTVEDSALCLLLFLFLALRDVKPSHSTRIPLSSRQG
jgi:hypothetical protein